MCDSNYHHPFAKLRFSRKIQWKNPSVLVLLETTLLLANRHTKQTAFIVTIYIQFPNEKVLIWSRAFKLAILPLSTSPPQHTHTYTHTKTLYTPPFFESYPSILRVPWKKKKKKKRKMRSYANNLLKWTEPCVQYTLFLSQYHLFCCYRSYWQTVQLRGAPRWHATASWKSCGSRTWFMSKPLFARNTQTHSQVFTWSPVSAASRRQVGNDARQLSAFRSTAKQ